LKTLISRSSPLRNFLPDRNAITVYLTLHHASGGVFAFFWRLSKGWRSAVREPPVLKGLYETQPRQNLTTTHRWGINEKWHFQPPENEGNITVIIKRHRIGIMPVGGVFCL